MQYFHYLLALRVSKNPKQCCSMFIARDAAEFLAALKSIPPPFVGVVHETESSIFCFTSLADSPGINSGVKMCNHDAALFLYDDPIAICLGLACVALIECGGVNGQVLVVIIPTLTLRIAGDVADASWLN